MGCLHAFHIGNLCKPGRRKHAIVVGRLPEVGGPRLPGGRKQTVAAAFGVFDEKD